MRFIYFQFFSPYVMVRLNEKSEGDTSCRLLMSASGKLDETALTESNRARLVHGFCSHQPMKCSRHTALANIFPILKKMTKFAAFKSVQFSPIGDPCFFVSFQGCPVFPCSHSFSVFWPLDQTTCGGNVD